MGGLEASRNASPRRTYPTRRKGSICEEFNDDPLFYHYQRSSRGCTSSLPLTRKILSRGVGRLAGVGGARPLVVHTLIATRRVFVMGFGDAPLVYQCDLWWLRSSRRRNKRSLFSSIFSRLNIPVVYDTGNAMGLEGYFQVLLPHK